MPLVPLLRLGRTSLALGVLFVVPLVSPAAAQARADALPASASCEAQVTARNLRGAARASFLRRCERQTKGTCEQTAAARKLFGAARTSFVRRCAMERAGGV